MRFRKCLALAVAIAFGNAPTLALAQDKAALTFNMPRAVDINKGEAFAWSLCTNEPAPLTGQGATGGFTCSGPGAAVQGGCPPYRFRLGTAQDGGLNNFLPPGVFLEPSGVIHGTMKAIGALTRPGGVICVEDSCSNTPACRELELKPVNPDTRTLSSQKATLGQVNAPLAPATAAPAAPGGTGGAAAGQKKGGGGASLGKAIGLTALAAGAVAGGILAIGALNKNQGGRCDSGFAACRPPGVSGPGADKCCPVSSPYYCVGDGGCYASSFGTPAAGCRSTFYFCSTEF